MTDVCPIADGCVCLARKSFCGDQSNEHVSMVTAFGVLLSYRHDRDVISMTISDDTDIAL